MEVHRQNALWSAVPARTTFGLVDSERTRYAATLGATLLVLRVEQGITSQAEFGKLVGVSETTAARWERGEALPDAWELRELCRVLQVAAEDLLSPQPMNDREVLLARRAGRAVRRALDQAHGTS